MIIVLKQGTTQQEIDTVTNAVVVRGVSVSPIVGTEMTILGLTGDTSRIDPDQLESFHCVERIMKVAEPFKKANRAFHPAPSEIKIGNTVVGGKKTPIIGGGPPRGPPGSHEIGFPLEGCPRLRTESLVEHKNAERSGAQQAGKAHQKQQIAYFFFHAAWFHCSSSSSLSVSL